MWPTARLRQVAPPELAPFQPNPTDETWILTLDQIESGTGEILSKRTGIASQAGASTFPFDSGNVLYSKLRPYLNKVIWPRESGIATTELVPLRPRPGILHCGFLAYYLRSNQFMSFARNCVAGLKMPRIIMDRFWEHQIPLPSFSEQRKIVEILDQADAFRRKRGEADTKAEDILPALFYKMFGDPAKNPFRWEPTTLGKANAEVRYGLGQPPSSSCSGVPMIRATNIHAGRITETEMIRVDPEDVPKDRNAFLCAEEVIVVRSGAYTGDVAQVTEKWVGSVAGYDLVVNPGEEFCGEYIESYLLSPHIQKNYFGRLKARAGQPHLNAAQLLEAPILRPPKGLQQEFARKARSIRAQRELRELALSKSETLFSVVLHRAFSGHLTAKWREAYMKELLAEMEQQAKVLEATC